MGAFACFQTANAGPAVDWLALQSNADGSYAALNDIATPYQATAETLRAFRVLGETAQPGIPAAEQFINNEAFQNTEYLSRKIIANAQAGGDASALVAALLGYQNADGGFGDFATYESTILDTAFALEALATAGQPASSAIARAIVFLMDNQAADGSWVDGASQPSIYITALAAQALTQYWSQYVGVRAVLAKASGFLLAQRDGGGLWPETFESALALIAIIPTLADRSMVAGSLAALAATQLADGSWEDDVYATALALRVLKIAESPVLNTDLATIRGGLVDGNTGLPLAGVDVTLLGTTPRQTVSGSDGIFVLTGLAAGYYTLQLTFPDYAAITATTFAARGQIVDLGTLQMFVSAGATTGTIRGTVTDAATGLPLKDVLVKLKGLTVSAVTGVDGKYQIDDVPSGPVWIDAAKIGYVSQAGGGYLAAGGVVIYSPSLGAEGAAPSFVTGVVVDSTSNVPLSGVSIEADFGGSVQTFGTGTDGRFTITGLAAASGSLTFSLGGYLSTSTSLVLEPLSSVDLGQIRLRPESLADQLPDLVPNEIDALGVTADPQTLGLSGTLDALLENKGTSPTPTYVELLAFYDANFNGAYDADIDVVLGQAVSAGGLNPGASERISIPVQGTLPFRDAPLSVWVDSTEDVFEKNESNNVKTTSGDCLVQPVGSGAPIDPVLKWERRITRGAHAPLVGPMTDTNGDGVIDEQDTPAIITVIGLDWAAVSGADGSIIWQTQFNAIAGGRISDVPDSANPALGDLDGDGRPEVVAYLYRRNVVAINNDGSVKWVSVPSDGPSNNTALTIADIDSDGQAEVLAGNLVLNSDGSVKWRGAASLLSYSIPLVVDLDLDGVSEVVMGPNVYRADGSLYFTLSPYSWRNYGAVANLDDDPFPELIINSGIGLTVFEHDGTVKWGPLRSGTAPPLVADMDGDGTPEIGVASQFYYRLLNSDGSLRWETPIYDISSGITGASAFDLNGDGTREIVYADENDLMIFNGATGEVVFQTPHRSATWVEYPTIADVDNDGRADIIKHSTSWLRVYQDRNNAWMPVRGIWNQHNYHVDNINDDAGLPRIAPQGWQTHNTFRANLARSSAIDLSAGHLVLQGNGPGQAATLTVRIGNSGKTPSLDGVIVRFYEGDPSTGGTLLGETQIGAMSPNTYQDVQLDGVMGLSGLVDLYAVVDPDNQVSECDEDNNTARLPAGVWTPLGNIAVATDKPIYGPNTPVVLQANVTNPGTLPGTFNAELLIEDTNGAVMTRFAIRNLGMLAGGDTKTFSENWNTATYIAATYRVRGILRDGQGLILDETTTAFEIWDSDTGQPALTLRTTVDKPAYDTSDAVSVANLIRNVSVNAVIDNANLKIVITDPTAQTYFIQEGPIDQIVPGGNRNMVIGMQLQNAPQGFYGVQGTVVDAATGKALATDQTQFEVKFDLNRALTGTVAAQLGTLYVGETQTCTGTTTNSGDLQISGLEVHHALVSMDSQTLIKDETAIISLTSGARDTYIQGLPSNGLAPGDYSCVLQVRVDGQLKTLAFAPFTLIEPPIVIDTEMKQGDRGRLLVLLDGNDDPDDDDKDKDDDDQGSYQSGKGPDMAARKAFLETLLDQAGWSYTIVQDEDDFARELRSGAYMVYALFAEREKLDKQVQKELREAVFRGEGLLVADLSDSKLNKLWGALGVQFKGKLNDADKVLLQASDLSAGGQADLIKNEDVLRVELQTALSVATYPETAPGQGNEKCKGGIKVDDNDNDKDKDKDKDCTNNRDAITLNDYGSGRTAFAGFDWLGAVTANGAGDPLATALTNALDYVHPAIIETREAAVVPVEIRMQNQGISTPGRLSVSIPSDVTVIDAGGGALSASTLRWTFTLGDSEAKKFIFWARLPRLAKDVAYTATIEVGEGPNGLVPHASLNLVIAVPSQEGAADIIAGIDNVVVGGTADKKALQKARKALDKAQNKLSQGKPQKAIKEAIKAADALVKSDDPQIESIRQRIDWWIRWVALSVSGS